MINHIFYCFEDRQNFYIKYKLEAKNTLELYRLKTNMLENSSTTINWVVNWPSRAGLDVLLGGERIYM